MLTLLRVEDDRPAEGPAHEVDAYDASTPDVRRCVLRCSCGTSTHAESWKAAGELMDVHLEGFAS